MAIKYDKYEEIINIIGQATLLTILKNLDGNRLSSKGKVQVRSFPIR